MKEHQVQYLYSSLSDIQSTIRAVDTKVSYLLVILFIPLTKLNAIYTHIKALLLHESKGISIISGVLAFLFCLAWIISIWCALRAIIAIDNPKHHIDGDKPESKFYPADLFNHGFWSVMGIVKEKSTIQFNRHYTEIPTDLEEISKQLTFEQMKAIYIATIKISRSKYAYYTTIAWVATGGILWFLHLIFI